MRALPKPHLHQNLRQRQLPHPLPKLRVAPTPKAPEATTETPKAPHNSQRNSKEAPETPNAEAASAPKAPETPITPTAAPAAEVPKEEIFTIERTAPAPSLNIVGKIDLEALNQNTRPKKRAATNAVEAVPEHPAHHRPKPTARSVAA